MRMTELIPPGDFSYFEMINDVVQKGPADALDPEIMGSLAAVGIVKGKPFNPDAQMKQILTDAAAIATAAGGTLNWHPRPSEGWFYYPGSSADGTITPYPPTGYRTLNSRMAMFFYATGITPAMIMRLTGTASRQTSRRRSSGR